MSQARKRILLIDDDKSILRILSRTLKEYGYDVDTAETGKEAKEKTTLNSYDLAMIDVKLPDVDGLDLLKNLHECHPEMMKIILTGFASMENGAKAIERGADAYLVKPVKPEELLRILEEKFKEYEKT